MLGVPGDTRIIPLSSISMCSAVMGQDGIDRVGCGYGIEEGRRGLAGGSARSAMSTCSESVTGVLTEASELRFVSSNFSWVESREA